MKYSRTKMEKLVKNDPELSKRLKQIMAELELGEKFRVKSVVSCGCKRWWKPSKKLSGTVNTLKAWRVYYDCHAFFDEL